MKGLAQVLWDSACGEPIAARIAIAGDFLPAGALARPTGGWREAARALAPHFSDVDFAIVNLECALDAEGLAPRPLAGLGIIVSAPSAALDYLTEVRARAIGLANNHSYDFGSVGVKHTLRALSARNLVPLGAGSTLCNAPGTFVWHGPANIRVGFWAAATASRDLATRTREGVEPATLLRASQAHEALEAAGANFSIALLHSGCIRTNRPDPTDASLIDEIAKCGFAIVAASHSHRISGAQSFALRPGSPSLCFYGLGSIVSGYIASPLEREGLIVVAGFHADGRLARVEIRPVLIGESGFGAVPSREAGQEILDRFDRFSSEIADGSARRLFYQDLWPRLTRLYLRDVSAAFRASGLRGLMRKVGRLRMRHVRRVVHGLMG